MTNVPKMVAANQALQTCTDRLVAIILADGNELSLVVVTIPKSGRLWVSRMEAQALSRATIVVSREVLVKNRRVAY